MQELTLEKAKKLEYNDHLTHKILKNSLGPIRVKVNGKPKIWKRQPNKISIPYKYGLYEYGYITENNLDNWLTE